MKHDHFSHELPHLTPPERESKLPEHKLPHLDLKDLLHESSLLDDHGDVIIGDRKDRPKFESDRSTQ